jgi:hypothetical protein
VLDADGGVLVSTPGSSGHSKASTSLQVSILESCRDRNIVQFIGAVSDRQQTMLVTE